MKASLRTIIRVYMHVMNIPAQRGIMQDNANLISLYAG